MQYQDAGIVAMRGTNSARSADIYANGSFRFLNRTHYALFGFNYNSYNQVTRYGNILSDTVYDGVNINNTNSVPRPSAGSISYQDDPDGYGTQDNATQWGFYGQLRLEVIKHLFLILGGRVSRFSERIRYISPGPTSSWKPEANIHGELTPYLGTVYQITPNIS